MLTPSPALTPAPGLTPPGLAPTPAAAPVAPTPPGGTGTYPALGRTTPDPAPVPLDADKRRWQFLIGTLTVLALLSVCGLGSFFIVADERKGQEARAAGAAPSPTALPRDISSRAVDAAPLTAKEVFPDPQVVINPNEAPYKVLKTQEAKDCRTATAGAISKLLAELGCTQVVRGTLRSPNGAYLVTAGVFNLEDVAGAEWAHEKIKPLVDGEKGRFQGMVAGKGTESVALSSAQVGWHVRGHYLVYCVIARADGRAVDDADPYARQILYDMIELHLRGGVLEKRATVPVGQSPTAKPRG